MNTTEIKLNLISQITQINDFHIIEEIQNLLYFELNKNIYTLNEKQKIRLTEAKKDNVITKQEADKEIEKWLNDK